MDRSLADLLVGRTLVGRYEIEEVIGRGGMSVVYRARDERLGRPVAVKVISYPENGAGEQAEMRERLRREAASAARIPPHPNVVQVYDYGTDPELGVDFIAMELLRGEDLKQIVRAGLPPLEDALRLLDGAASGVAAGHRVGIVHRDLKPSNIIIVDDGGGRTVKIVDFGIAKALRAAAEDDLTRTGHVPHSPAYASPEQMHRGAPLTTASDVYQLGLIGYELLSGERPYTATEHDRIKQGETLPLPSRGRWEKIPEETRRVIERALRSDPGERYRDAEAFAIALAEGDDTTLLVEPGVRVHTPDLPPQNLHQDTTRPVTGRLPGKPVLLAAGALLALLLVWLVSRGRDEPGTVTPVAAVVSDSAVDDEFRALRLAAYENLAEASSGEAGADAATAVGRVVEDLVDALVSGDVERHMSHYADRVDFYGQPMDRAAVERSREEMISVYPQRQMQLARTAINFPEPGRAQVLVDKGWEFDGEDGRWTGSSRSEYTLEQRDGEWLVTGEKDLEVFNDEHDR